MTKVLSSLTFLFRRASSRDLRTIMHAADCGAIHRSNGEWKAETVWNRRCRALYEAAYHETERRRKRKRKA